MSKLAPNKAFLYEVVRVWAMKLIKGENIWQFEKKIFCFPTQVFWEKIHCSPGPTYKGLKYWGSLTTKNKAAADQNVFVEKFHFSFMFQNSI